MGKIILITGGARSGKSRYGEDLVKGLGEKILYVATAIPTDDEMRDRIEKHKISRPQNWDTLEAYEDLGIVLKDKIGCYDGVLLDCVTVLITNLLFKMSYINFADLKHEDFQKAEQYIKEEFEKLISTVKNEDTTVVMITNELGSGIVPETILGREFRDIAGRINQYIAYSADEVYLTVCGIPLKIK